MRKKALTKNERQIQIISWFAIRYQNDNEDYATMSEIARGIGVSPSTKLRKIIDELVPDKLEKSALKRSGRWDGWGYKLAEGTYERPKRLITVNSSRKNVKQTEMFSW